MQNRGGVVNVDHGAYPIACLRPDTDTTNAHTHTHKCATHPCDATAVEERSRFCQTETVQSERPAPKTTRFSTSVENPFASQQHRQHIDILVGAPRTQPHHPPHPPCGATTTTTCVACLCGNSSTPYTVSVSRRIVLSCRKTEVST